ncbi:MAG: hypothetical protein ABJQ34_04635 [Paracoccaceae bacterium]
MAPAAAAVGRRAGAAATHQPEGNATDSAIAASNRPEMTQRRNAEGAGITAADAAETGEVNQNSFETALRVAIARAMPDARNESDAREVMAEGAGRAASQVQETLGEQQTAAIGNLPATVSEEAQLDPSAQPGGEEVELVPEAVGPAPEGVSAGPVVPPPSTPAAVDTSTNRDGADALAADNNITDRQLASGNDPQFQATLGARDEAETHDREAPAALREAEGADRQNTHARAAGAITGGLTDFQNMRTTEMGDVATQQTTTQSDTERRKQEITEDIEAIGLAVRADVIRILQEMDDGAADLFQTAIDEAMDDYDNAFAEEKGGLLTSVGDFLTGDWGDERFNRALAQGRRAFEARVETAITDIAAFVERKLTEARDRIAEGRTEIETYMTENVSEAERELAETAATAITADFDALETEVSDRRDALVDNMVDIYRQGIERRNAREEQLQEENKSFWERVYDATVGVIQKVIEFKNMLLGILSRAAAVVEAIIQDPIGFLRNLIAGIGAGLERFVSNIGENLKNALMGWLFGALEGAGINLPDKFDLKGFLDVVLQVLGLTKENVRARAVGILGEDMVAKIEGAVDFLRILFTEGPAGIWQMLLEKLSTIKDVIIDEIKSWVITKIVEAGIKWIIGLLNPAGAFVKACMMIYDIVIFFIERGQQIIAAVNAIINALGTIVAGNIGAMAAAVEGALNRILPVVISFLASLLGLGGISEKIRGVIEKVQEPVNRAIDWVINLGVSMARRIAGLFSRDEPEQESVEDGDGVNPHDLTPEQRLARAEEQLPAKINRELVDGISTEALERKLAVWREEYGLRELVIQNGGIVAKINPESRLADAHPMRKQQIGGLLEEILESAEADFLTEYEAQQSRESRQHDVEADAAAIGGSSDFQNMDRVDAVRFMRRIQTGRTQLRPPQYDYSERPNPRLLPGPPGTTIYQNHPNLLSATYQSGAGSYDSMHEIMEGAGQDEADLARARARLASPSRTSLTGTVEPARVPGGLGWRMIAEGEVSAGLAVPEDADIGALAPMAADQATVAAELDFGMRGPASLRPGQAEQAGVATSIRHERIANIFSVLEAFVAEPDVELHGTDAALANLAEAFRAWLSIHFPDGGESYTEEELEAATASLRRDITGFMHRMGDE